MRQPRVAGTEHMENLSGPPATAPASPPSAATLASKRETSRSDDSALPTRDDFQYHLLVVAPLANSLLQGLDPCAVDELA